MDYQEKATKEVMDCPNCGKQNSDNTQSCSSCGCTLMQTPDEQNRPDVKTSGFAVASLVLGLLSFCTYGITAIPAIVLGIISLVKIEKSGGRLTGGSLAKTGIAIPVIVCFLILIFRPLTRLRHIYYRGCCQSNLRGIGLDMSIYLNDWDKGFPRAGGPSSKWGTTPNWKADNRADAYGLTDGAPGQASISASLFTMYRSYSTGGVISFVCPADSGTTQLNTADYGFYDKDLYDLWDFGPDPSKHCSYSYHMPYGPYPLTKSHNPAIPVMSDRNPWQDAPGYSARPKSDFVSFNPNGPKKLVRRGNAIPHQGKGQNVLFVDCHVKFRKTSACGVNGDNIYTYWNDKDISRGTRPVLGSQPADKLDSLLVHDPPAGDFK